MKIRKEEKRDYESIYELNKKAFNQIDESELINRIRKSPNYIPELSLIAEKNDVVIGHILFSKIKLIGEKEYETLSLAPLAVLPEYQNKGVGGKLVRYGLKMAAELGYDSVIVVGYKDYYPRFGFEKASNWGIKCPFEAPDEAVMAIELRKGSLKDKTGIIKYPKEFGL